MFPPFKKKRGGGGDKFYSVLRGVRGPGGGVTKKFFTRDFTIV